MRRSLRGRWPPSIPARGRRRRPSGMRRYVPALDWLPRLRPRGPPLRRDRRRDDLGASRARDDRLRRARRPAAAGRASTPCSSSLAAYAIFGTSRHVVAAGTSAAAVLLASTVIALHPASSPDYLVDAATMVLFCGGLFLLAGALPARVRRAVPLEAGDRGLRLRARDLRHGQAAAEALRDRGRRREHDPPARPRDRRISTTRTGSRSSIGPPRSRSCSPASAGSRGSREGSSCSCSGSPSAPASTSRATASTSSGSCRPGCRRSRSRTRPPATSPRSSRAQPGCCS